MVRYIHPCGCDKPIKENGLFFITILTTNSVINELNKKIPTLILQMKYTEPCEGKIFFSLQKSARFFRGIFRGKIFYDLYELSGAQHKL